MKSYISKYFGEIDLDNIKEYYETEIELNERLVELTINASTVARQIDKESIEEIDNYIEAFQNNEREIRSFIHKDFKRAGETKNYIDIQIEYQEKDDIANLIEDADKGITKQERLLSVLYLLRVGFYPEKQDKSFAVFDYTIEEELTDDLLVVIIDKNKEMRITIES